MKEDFKDLNVGEIPLIEFIKQYNKIKIPPYQREYCWKPINSEKLIESISNIESNKNLFIGFCIFEKDKDGEIIIIDGQQRIITMTLIILYIYNKLPNLRNDLKDILYFDKNKKLELLENDNEDLKQIYEKLNGATGSHIFNNYNKIKNKLDIKYSNNPYDFYEKLKRTTIVFKRVNEVDKADNIFETINATGVHLTEMDKIKNYIFNTVSIENQISLYDNDWKPIKKNIKLAENKHHIGNVSILEDKFISNFLQYSNIDSISKNLYDDFRRLFDKKNFIKTDERSLNILINLNEISEIYKNIKKQSIEIKDKDKEIILNNYIYEIIVELKSIVNIPLLIYLVKKLQEKNEIIDDILEILKLLTSYIFRSKLSKTAGDKQKDLHTCLRKIKYQFIKDYEGNNSDLYGYFVDLLNRFTSQKESTKFLSDDDFKKAIKDSDFYNKADKFGKYFLIKIENKYREKIGKMLLNFKDEEIITVEHILPKNQSNPTMDDNEYKNNNGKIGNLTLLTKKENSTARDKEFNHKKEEIYRNTKFLYTQKLADLDNFSIESVKERGKKLTDETELLDIWIKLPKSNDKSKSDYHIRLDTWDSENETASFGGKKIKHVYIKDDNMYHHEYGHWNDIFKYIFDKVQKKENANSIIMSCINEDTEGLYYVKEDIDINENYYNICKDDNDTEYYIQIPESPQDNIKLIQNLINHYDIIKPEDIIISKDILSNPKDYFES